jgi:hypothetical protein
MTQRLLLGAGIAGAVLLAWVATWRFAVPDGYLGYDLVAYINAAARLIATGSPYSNEVLAGPVANIPSNVQIGYFYPPPLAQLFVPLVDVPYRVIAAVWIVSQAMAAFLVFPRLIPAGVGARVGIATFVTLITQAFHSALLGGNVSGWIAIGVGAMLVAPGAVSGSVAAVLTAFKLTPVPLLIAAIVARRIPIAAVATGVAILTISAALSPKAWLDWVSVLPNILRNEMSQLGANLSPAHAISDLGLPGIGGIAGIGIAISFLIWALFYAREDEDLTPRVTTAGVAAMTFASSTLWDHYLAVIVPLTLYWWFRVGTRRRIGILVINLTLGGMWLGLEAVPAYRCLVACAVVAFFVIAGSALTVDPISTKTALPSWGHRELKDVS